MNYILAMDILHAVRSTHLQVPMNDILAMDVLHASGDVNQCRGDNMKIWSLGAVDQEVEEGRPLEILEGRMAQLL